MAKFDRSRENARKAVLKRYHNSSISGNTLYTKGRTFTMKNSTYELLRKAGISNVCWLKGDMGIW